MTLSRDKIEITVFAQKDQHHIEQVQFIGNIMRPKVSCRSLGLQIDNKLNLGAELHTVLTKVATSISSIYLVRQLTLIKSRIVVF